MLRSVADGVRANAEELARLETLANGKPYRNTLAEMAAAASWLDYYAGVGENLEGHLRQVSATVDAEVRTEPLGVVVAITPFNGALSLGCWKIAPALVTGNTIVVKPPADAPASTIRLAEIAADAGLPQGVLNVVIGDEEVGGALVAHDDVAMVSFTGSTAVAKRLGAVTGGLMKRFSCEAGGKSAQIVFADADLDAAVAGATQGVFSAAGQTCVAGSRILVHERVYDAFVERFVGCARELRVGDPFEPETQVGPLASDRRRDSVASFVVEAVGDGAQLLAGGKAPSMTGDLSAGSWYEPTILADVTDQMRVWREEIFGPVAAVRRFCTDDEAVQLANDSRYGLAAGIWTSDLHRVRRLSRELEAGTVWVNSYRVMDRAVPFGGYKDSGLGRENGVEAMAEFTQLKSVVTDYGRAQSPFPIPVRSTSDETRETE